MRFLGLVNPFSQEKKTCVFEVRFDRASKNKSYKKTEP